MILNNAFRGQYGPDRLREAQTDNAKCRIVSCGDMRIQLRPAGYPAGRSFSQCLMFGGVLLSHTL
ncbi:hypothetical protein, partial [Glycomyces salinus]|uniref:hypothetical protein n=1 Tax=Glycomyces salinus TaxID=980294 RepID=UPI001E2D2FA7